MAGAADHQPGSRVADLMSHRWLIPISMGAHLLVAGGLFASGVWHIERLHASPRATHDLLQPWSPPAPAGGLVAVKIPEIPPKPHRHPPPVIVQQQPPSTAVATVDTSEHSDTGVGPGPGDPDSIGTCTQNCAETGHADPVCGNGSVEVGEQCDDGNTASGDGCSSTCQIEVRPRPTPLLAPSVMQGLRVSGDTQIHPSSTTQLLMVRDGAHRVVGSVKLCISTDGGVISAAMASSTKYRDYDAALVSAVRDWRYRPYLLNGNAVPACSMVSFIYTIQ
jgi:cysteine-rich repeat protein